MTDDELKFFSNGHIDGMQRLAKKVLNLGMAEMQLNRYRVVALLFRLGQAEEIQAFLSMFRIPPTNFRTYNFMNVPTGGKTRDGGKILYQVMYGYRLAIYKRPESFRIIMNRRKQLLKEVNI